MAKLLRLQRHAVGNTAGAVLEDPSTAGARDLSAVKGPGRVRSPGRTNTDFPEAPPDAPTHLDKAEVAAAIAFYRSRKASYTPEILHQIQGAVGAPTADVADAELVQAVASWQRTEGAAHKPVLKVDGQAGPRTLPRMFASGLQSPGRAEAFRAEGQEVTGRWAELGNADARLKAMEDLMVPRLRAAGVAIPPKFVKGDTQGAEGELDIEVWKLRIAEERLDAPTLTASDALNTLGTIYHESRHAEQWWKMAAYLGGIGKSKGFIVAHTGISPDVAEVARKPANRLDEMQALVAKGWFDSVGGAGSHHRELVLDRVVAANKVLLCAKQANKEHPSPANELKLAQARARFQPALAAYQDLPEENDAFATEDPVDFDADPPPDLKCPK